VDVVQLNVFRFTVRNVRYFAEFSVCTYSLCDSQDSSYRCQWSSLRYYKYTVVEAWCLNIYNRLTHWVSGLCVLFCILKARKNIQNYWVSGHYPLSRIRNTRKQPFGNCICFHPQVRVGERRRLLCWFP
jgi:hypothetical protein